MIPNQNQRKNSDQVSYPASTGKRMDETNWSTDFYSDALKSFSYINKYSKTEILAFFYARPIWNYSPDYPLNCTPLSPITTTNYVPSAAVQDITNETEIKCKNSSNKHVSRPKRGWLASQSTFTGILCCFI